MNFLLPTIYAALGTLCFAVLFHVPPRFYFGCACVGGAGWGVYLAAQALGAGSVSATLAASVPLALLSRLFAVKAKAPATLFLLCGIFPLVPGAGIYYTAYYFVSGQMGLFSLQLAEVIKVALALSVGIAAVLSIPLPHSRVYGPRGEVEKAVSFSRFRH